MDRLEATSGENNAGPWPLRWIAGGVNELRALGEWPPAPGTCYPAPWLRDPTNPFHKDLARALVGREAIAIWLPGGRVWFPDCAPSTDPNHEPWGLVPENPGPGETMEAWVGRLTATPSINLRGEYHGYLEHGMLRPDIEGHRFRNGGRSMIGRGTRA